MKAKSPALLEDLNEITAAMDEGAVTEYIALLTQVQSLLDSGMTAGRGAEPCSRSWISQRRNGSDRGHSDVPERPKEPGAARSRESMFSEAHARTRC